MPIAVAVPASIKSFDGGSVRPQRSGVEQITLELLFSGSYAAGGEVVAPTFESFFKILGSGQVTFVQIPVRLGYMFEYDYATKKVLVRQGDNTNVASAPGIELAAAAYPAAITALAAGNRVRALVQGT